jgi:cysteinyl-tRNA synthetase
VRELRLYDTLTRQKRRFEPLREGEVGIYSCGPTVYSHAHIGNMRPYLFADLLKRTLLAVGYRVRHVINITDVGHLTDDADAGEDKMELGARRQGLSAWQLADKWTRVFLQDLERLGVLPPDVWCKATDHIPEQIELIEILERKGFTYRTSDGIYFDVSKDPHYGELARLDLAAQQAGERIEKASEKRSPADFALWKLSPREGPRRQMEWPSPWGTGFPGWHAECSAMSSKYLGVPFDIHTGGVEHIPVHHTNEIAQSENAFEVRPWVRYWMHEEWLVSPSGEKISKSTGGLWTLDELVELGIEPRAFRLFFLQAHYRQKQAASLEAFRGAQAAYTRLVRHAEELREATQRGGEGTARGLRERFFDAVADDLNAPQALAVLWEAVRAPEIGPATKWDLVREMDAVLGLGLETARISGGDLDAEIEALVAEREAARRARDYARADAIRAELAGRGIVLEDSKEGVRWRRG